MPLWDFRCPTCQTVSTQMFPSLDRANTDATCPSCHGPVERLPAAGGFVVKGFNAKNRYSHSS